MEYRICNALSFVRQWLCSPLCNSIVLHRWHCLPFFYNNRSVFGSNFLLFKMHTFRSFSNFSTRQAIGIKHGSASFQLWPNWWTFTWPGNSATKEAWISFLQATCYWIGYICRNVWQCLLSKPNVHLAGDITHWTFRKWWETLSCEDKFAFILSTRTFIHVSNSLIL